ncbi:unnamed protein product [Thelazia callipaeda]|uniref:MARVEL domain-containing protein n=1 Tax=Thelazia callipaeda TaxID=103827 RepID=A0A0N5CVG2_THECL|nr:unnamed protein product [Thelazia callipaeda]
MASSYASFVLTRSNHYSLKVITYSRVFQLVLAILIIFTLAESHPTPPSTLLWIIAVVQFYNLLMTILTAICVPLSTYCIAYLPEGSKYLYQPSTVYILIALLNIFLAASFMLCLLIWNDFVQCEGCPEDQILHLEVRRQSDEYYPLLPREVAYGKYQAF